MTEIIPAIIAKNFDDFKSKVEKVQDIVDWIHLDVVDGKFAKNTTWGDPKILLNYDADAFLSVHLMVEKPEEQIEAWALSSVRRIFFHHESTEAHEEIIRICKKNETSVGIALKVETPIDVLEPWIEKIDAVLLMGVDLGFYGSPFQEKVIAKIHNIKGFYPRIKIVVDGGMNPERAKLAADTGADFIVSGGYIFNSDNPKEAIEKLRGNL